MLLEEIHDRLKRTNITDEQLRQISPIDCLLSFDKDDKSDRWERLDRAERDLIAKECYINAKARLEDLETEKSGLEEIVNNYKPV